MQLQPAPAPTGLVQFNVQLLEDARTIVRAHEQRGVAYGGPVAAHLRHVIEHHQALLLPAQAGVADYDSRARERELETDGALVHQRLQSLQTLLRGLRGGTLDAPLRVRGLCGHAGQSAFEVASTFERELAFVAGHAVHHFALMKTHCQALGIDLEACLGADVGKAPATVAHERSAAAARAPSNHPSTLIPDPEFSCTPAPSFA